jgi:hypothetical protein
MQRYRITLTEPAGPEQTWVLLPDQESAFMQAQELAQRQATAQVRVYREVTGEERQVALELEPGKRKL